MDEKITDSISGGTLAYLGDCVFELFVRERLIRNGIGDLGKLNDEAKKYVTAKAQCEFFRRIENELTERETEIFKRGRNSTHTGNARSASMSEYRTASGLEALCAYLYLSEQKPRLYEILEKIFV